jgi:hypothetical protein
MNSVALGPVASERFVTPTTRADIRVARLVTGDDFSRADKPFIFSSRAGFSRRHWACFGFFRSLFSGSPAK